MSTQKALIILLIIVITALIGIGGYLYFSVFEPFNKPNQPASVNIVEEINRINEPEVSAETEGENLVDKNVAGVGPLTLPDNFNISIFAQDLGKVRVLRFDPRGNLLASLNDAGQIVSLNDVNNDGKGEMKTILVDLNLPHGIAINCNEPITREECDLYIAETDQVNLYSYNPDTITATFVRRLFTLPSGSSHFTRTIEIFDYNGKPMLFTSVGSSCNVCRESDSKRAAVLISNLDGSGVHVFSSGLRNAVFLEQKPGTDEIWVTEMGRDRIGDDIPPEEINILQDGGFYGWPLCYDDKVQDTTFDGSSQAAQRCASSIPPRVKMQAHSAPLGLDFVPSEWPSIYKDDLLVAFHGSWNRTVPTGYKIIRIVLDEEGNYESQEDFITGWLTDNGEVLGRPVDVESNGSDLYISDDKAGVIYKLSLN